MLALGHHKRNKLLFYEIVNVKKIIDFEKINKIRKLPGKLTEKKERTQITSISNERRDITHQYKFYGNQKYDKGLIPRKTQFTKTHTEEIDNLNKPISVKENESVISNLQNQKATGPDGLTVHFVKDLKKK